MYEEDELQNLDENYFLDKFDFELPQFKFYEDNITANSNKKQIDLAKAAEKLKNDELIYTELEEKLFLRFLVFIRII